MRRPLPPRDIPPPLELECLKALWSLGEGTVRDVRQVLVGNRNLAYTTVMTVLERLQKRGGVSRRKTGRSFRYMPKVSQDTLRRLAIKELIDDFFDGSEDTLMSYLQTVTAPGTQNPDARQDPMDATLL